MVRLTLFQNDNTKIPRMNHCTYFTYGILTQLIQITDLKRQLKRSLRPSPYATWWDVLWKSPKSPNIQDLLATFLGLLRDQNKNWWFNEKSVFRCNSPCFTHLLLLFYWQNKYSKVLNEDVHGTSTGPSWGTSQGPNDGTLWGRSRDVGHTHFLNPTQNHIKLTLTGCSRLFSEL